MDTNGHELRTAAGIIARGGSKRLPRKNVREFCGLPLVAWTIIQAQSTHGIDDVWLSTDDDEIAGIGREYGAQVIRRPDWPDADQVAANRVYGHMFEKWEEIGYWPHRFITMFPTSPLRPPDLVDRCIEHHKQTGFHVHPMARNRETVLHRDVCGLIGQRVIFDKQGRYLVENSGIANVCDANWYRWHMAELARQTNSLDVALDALADQHCEMSKHPDAVSYYVECPAWCLVEVDTLAEFELAEVLMEHYILRGRGRAVYDEYARGETDD